MITLVVHGFLSRICFNNPPLYMTLQSTYACIQIWEQAEADRLIKEMHNYYTAPNMRMTVKAVRSHKTFPLFILLLQFLFVLLCGVELCNAVLFYQGFIFFATLHRQRSSHRRRAGGTLRHRPHDEAHCQEWSVNRLLELFQVEDLLVIPLMLLRLAMIVQTLLKPR